MEKNFKAQPAPEVKLHFLDYWRIIRIRKTVILAVFLLVVLTTTAVTYILPKSYMSSVRIKVQKDIADVDTMAGNKSISAFDPFFIQTEFEVIQSALVLDQVILDKDLNLNRRWAIRYGVEGQPLKTPQTRSLLKRKIDVRQFRNTSMIEIRAYSEQQEEAAEIANKIAAVYKSTRIKQELERASQGIEKLEEELTHQNEELTKLQATVDYLRETNNISDAAVESGFVMTLEPETLRRLEAVRIEASSLSAKWGTLYRQLKNLPRDELAKAMPTAFPDPLLADLLGKQAMTEQQLTTSSKDLTDENVEVKRLKGLHETISKQIEARLDGVLGGLKTQLAAAEAQYTNAVAQLDAAKKNDIEKQKQYSTYFTLKRVLETQKKMRDALTMKITAEKIDVRIPRSAIVEITDPAEPGLRPVRPNIPLNIALGIVVGLLVGVGLAFFIEYLDTSVKTIDDVERTLQAPVLGVIPQNVGSLLDEGPESPHAESYRVLRTNILFSRKDDKLNTITVVSGGAGEGKSTTLFNLATVFAQSGQRVLIVDSDLRRPSIHKFLRVSNSVGLTNLLLKQNRLEEVIQTTSLPTLDFMPSGKLPSSSMGVLNSVAMKEMVQELKRRYEFVFFDSPPIMGVSDAAILASEVDLSLQVIQYRKYPQAMTIRAKQMVEKVGGNLVGVVLNNINMSQDENYYYYSGYYYDYYSKQDDETATKNNGQKKAAGEPQNRIDLKQKY
jgi:succinoglycan biosynthesis transport protein ExoP